MPANMPGRTRYRVTLTVTDEVVLEVIDNGKGIELPLEPGGGLGLSNLRSRAEQVGGTFEMQAADGGGTRMIWRAPC